MRNLHFFCLTNKTIFIFILSFFTASPAFASICPVGYGEVQREKIDEFSAAMLDKNESYSPKLLKKCKSGRSLGLGEFLCGKLHIKSISLDHPNFVISRVHVKPSNPSLKAVLFESVGFVKNLVIYNLPRDFQDEKRQVWCALNGTNSAICYEIIELNGLFLPRWRDIRKKLFVKRIVQNKLDCSKYTF